MELKKLESNELMRLSIEFSVEVIRYTQVLERKKHYSIANQLVKSATAIGANVMEAQNAESRADFIHKLKIAGKEADETQYWILICDKASLNPPISSLNTLLTSIQRLINSSITTAKKNSLSKH